MVTFCCVFLDLVIGFDLTTRTVNEGDPANLCASVVSGTIGREVPIGFRTEDSTARRENTLSLFCQM